MPSVRAVQAGQSPDRSWPTKSITHAPRWLSTDLRDGNQALIDPMSPTRKRAMFDLLVKMGYKEIEVGFPSASQTDFDFVRELIEADRIPADVRISVLTQAREDLIERSVQSLIGAQQATVHMYNATAPTFRKVVFRIGREECKQLAVAGTEHIMKYAEKYLDAAPPSATSTRPRSSWTPSWTSPWRPARPSWTSRSPAAGREIILNLPCTVEVSTPNVYADQIEWMSPHICPARRTSASPCTPTTTAAPASPRRAGRAGRRRPGRGLPVRQRRAHRQRLPRHPGAEPVHARASTR